MRPAPPTSSCSGTSRRSDPPALLAAALLFAAPLAGQSAAEWRRQGIEHFQAGRFDAAAQAFFEAVKLDERRADSWRMLGAAQAARERFELAETPFRKACELDPKDPNNCYYLGRNYYAMSRFEQALAAFDIALKARGRTWRVHQGAGLALEALGRNDEAEKRLREAVRLLGNEPPGATDPRVDLGAFLVRAGRPAEALPFLEKAAAQTGASSRAWFELGSALSELDRNQEALEKLRKAVQSEPNNWPAHLLLGKVCFRLGLADEARRHTEIGRRGVEESQRSRTVR
jgi:Flp pilus assembly protein TadD